MQRCWVHSDQGVSPTRAGSLSDGGLHDSSTSQSETDLREGSRLHDNHGVFSPELGDRSLFWVPYPSFDLAAVCEAAFYIQDTPFRTGPIHALRLSFVAFDVSFLACDTASPNKLPSDLTFVV